MAGIIGALVPREPKGGGGNQRYPEPINDTITGEDSQQVKGIFSNRKSQQNC